MTWLWAALRTRIGRALAGIGVKLVVAGVIYSKGRSDANRAREARDAKDYKNERQKIDDEISGIGGTDRERIERLQSIADRRGGRAD